MSVCPFVLSYSHIPTPMNSLSVHQMPPDLVSCPSHLTPSSSHSLMPCNNPFSLQSQSPELPRPSAHLSLPPSSSTLHIYWSSSFVPVSVRLYCHVPSCFSSVLPCGILSFLSTWTSLSNCCPVCRQLPVSLPACLPTCICLLACKPPI